MIEIIAFDADDTLWHNETLYQDAQERFVQLLSAYQDPAGIAQSLYETEMRNLAHFGYGIKSFALSMIETAIELTAGRISGSEINKIIEQAKEMLRAEVHLLEHVQETVATLSESYELMVITKGDLLDQQAKMARSGLAGYFKHVEVVDQKLPEIYQQILIRHHIPPEKFLMVGNSLRSDIQPVLALGAFAVHIPYPLTWAHEQEIDKQIDSPHCFELENISLLPDLVNQLNSGNSSIASKGGS
jgi:putative hydrolase of the HAD superfamily